MHSNALHAYNFHQIHANAYNARNDCKCYHSIRLVQLHKKIVIYLLLSMRMKYGKVQCNMESKMTISDMIPQNIE